MPVKGKRQGKPFLCLSKHSSTKTYGEMEVEFLWQYMEASD